MKQLTTSKLSAALIGLAIAGALLYTSLHTTPAPQVAFTSLKGEQFAMQDLRGKVVLVSFWATDCAACIKEMPHMIETHRKFEAQGFESVFVAMQHDRPDFVLHYAENNRLPFKVVLDPRGELARAFGNVKLTPTTFVVDRSGNVVTRILGEPDFAKLHSLLTEKLREAA